MLEKPRWLVEGVWLAVLMLVIGLGLTSCGDPTASLGPVATPAGTTGVPTVEGAQEVTLDAAFIAAFTQQLSKVRNPRVQLYVSDEEPEKLATAYSAALTTAGYSSVIPVRKQGEAQIGVYSKLDLGDLVFSALPVPKEEKELVRQSSLFNLPDEALKNVSEQVKGKKSAIFVVSAPGLLQQLFPVAPPAPVTVGPTTK